jgi:hypothetical protein
MWPDVPYQVACHIHKILEEKYLQITSDKKKYENLEMRREAIPVYKFEEIHVAVLLHDHLYKPAVLVHACNRRHIKTLNRPKRQERILNRE